MNEQYQIYDLRKINKELLEALGDVSPVLDALINRTPTGKKRNELCGMNIKVKQAIENATKT